MIARFAAFVGMLIIFTLVSPAPGQVARFRMAFTREAAQPTATPARGDVRADWARDLAARLGNPNPSPELIRFLVEWTLAEDGSLGAFNRHNPLNTTQSGLNATGCINEDCVRGYATYEDGMQATLQTLSYGAYTAIVAGIRANDPERAKAALFASPWASSHYGGGADWPQ